MSTNQSSSRRVNQNDIVQLDSPTLLSKLDHLESQMKLAFPSTKKSTTNDNLSKSIKSPTTPNNPSTIKSEQLRSTTTTILTQSINLNENKENINDKSIKIDDKIDDKKAKNSKEELFSSLDVQKTLLSKPNADTATKKTNESPAINETNQQSSSISKITTSVNISPTSNTITVNATTTSSTLTTNTSNKPLSAWKRTKILSKTLSSINVMKSRTVTSSSTTVQTLSNQQNLKIKDDSENQLKKSSSGNLVIDNHHHLNSPLNQTKRRSQEEVSSGLNVNTPRLSSSLSSSCQTSIHNLNESTKANPQAAIQAALNNLNQSTGTYNIPDNYNTTIINQLNKNYLKNIQKQKARSDWKSLKNKLIGLARKESEEDASVEQNNSKVVDNQESATATASQRKLSNSNQADDGIICKKEDLFFLLRNSNLAKSKQRRSNNKPSLADVVVQLATESKAKKSNNASTGQNKQDKAQNLNENPSKKTINETNQSIQVHENSSPKNLTNSLPKSKQASNGRVQFVLSNNEQNASSSSASSTNKIKSSLKKTSSTTSTNVVDKNQNSLTRQTKSNTINNMNLNKKKVKIYETDQDGIRKALILQSVKDRNNNENSLNEEDDLNDKNKSKAHKIESLDEDDENKEDDNDYKVKWDNENVVDAGALGDAIAAFLSSITTSTPTTNQTTEKKVSFKK